MWELQRLTTVWAFTACYRDNFTFYYFHRHFILTVILLNSKRINLPINGKLIILFFFTGSTASLPRALASAFSFVIILQTVGLLGRVISSSQGLYLNTGQHKHGINTYTPNIHVLCGIRTHDPSFRASEDSSSLRPLGYCDRHLLYLACLILNYTTNDIICLG
jgi:hypothetical protein